MNRKIVCLILCVVFVFLTSCQSHFSGGNSSISEGAAEYDTFITVDVYDSLANFQGIQSGWFAKIVKDKFNMELNIIAPNTSGNADTLFDTRFAAGKIGDLIICSSAGGKLQNMVDAGLIINMSDYVDTLALFSNYHTAIKDLNSSISTDGIYAIPSDISSSTSLTPSEALAPIYGSYVRWDYYSELGYPKVDTFEDFLPILKKMQEEHPVCDENGAPTYAFSFFPDWDRFFMNAIKQPCCFYGYDEEGFVLSKADGSDFQNILDANSIYMRMLKFYFEANQEGLVDPESRTQTYTEVHNKFRAGQILFSPWPWLAQDAFNTASHLAEGKAYMFVPIEDELIYSYGCNTYGNGNTIIAVGNNSPDPVRLIRFVDWLYSPEGIMTQCAMPKNATAGPEGLTWELTDDGPVLTEFGKKVFSEDNVSVPEEWGGGTWDDGISALNFAPVSDSEKTPDGYYYYYSLWDSVRSQTLSDIEKDWVSYVGSTSVFDYLDKTNGVIISPGVEFKEQAETTELSSIRTQCARLIINYSWNMVFAKDEAEFSTLYDELTNKVYALGYDKILNFDMSNAKRKAQSK